MSREGESNLFDLFDRPSMETPEILLGRLGEQGLADLQTELDEKLKEQQVEVQDLREKLDTALANQQSLRADLSMVLQAKQLGRDKGLE
ncbi:MAG TPA: hypothetical protein VGE34_01350 [Candidatus Saccharimonadales bacterium]